LNELRVDVNKVLPMEKLAAVYIGEMLGQIFFGWNKVFVYHDLCKPFSATAIQYT